MAGVVKITLDAETFRALASATRLQVLRALDTRRKTLTELARDLALNKATVHEHLQLLTSAELVRKRDDEGRKWIYYELTWRGQKLLHPQETTTFNVLLGLSIAAAGGGTVMLGRAIYLWLQSQPGPTSGESGNSSQPQDVGAAGANSSSSAPPAASSGGAQPSGSSPPSSGSNTASGAPASPPQDTTFNDHGGAAGSTVANTQTPDANQTDVFHEGGWLALALLACALLFTLLAFMMRRRLRPGKFVPPSGGEGASASSSPMARPPGPPSPPGRKP
jgi:DNA-binding transcriptional ArsR family regulator